MSERYLIVTAKPKDGFRRAGIRFDNKPTKIPYEELTKDQIKMLKSDDNLVVQDTHGADFVAPSKTDESDVKEQVENLQKELGGTKSALKDVTKERDIAQKSLEAAEKALEKEKEKSAALQKAADEAEKDASKKK